MVTSNCSDCWYHGKLQSGDVPYCRYIFMTNQKRPCPAGDDCTVKVPYRRRTYPLRKKREV